MKKTFVYFQPEYVSKFQCNGQACSAHCCKLWRIEIDKKTYKKYSHIKPKSAAKEITQHLEKSTLGDNYVVKLDSKARCPMLTEDNWCRIQKNYGEEYLSVVCVTYPRVTYNCGDFFERSLSLTCPVVAALVLMPEEPMAFEQVEVSERVHNNLGRIYPQIPRLSIDILPHIVEIQTAAISILQERSLNLDSRLVVLGFFLDKLDEITANEKFDEISNLATFYMSEKFLQEQAPTLVKEIKFNAKEHIRAMLNTFETLYGGESHFLQKDQLLVDAVVDALGLDRAVDEKQQVSLASIVNQYNKLKSFRDAFVNAFSTILENYLVNEFFFNMYPYKINASITHNYGVFLTTYKMIELITMSRAMSIFRKDPTKRPPLDRINFVATVMLIANNIDHNPNYLNKTSEHLKGTEDMTTLLQNLLKT